MIGVFFVTLRIYYVASNHESIFPLKIIINNEDIPYWSMMIPFSLDFLKPGSYVVLKVS